MRKQEFLLSSGRYILPKANVQVDIETIVKSGTGSLSVARESYLDSASFALRDQWVCMGDDFHVSIDLSLDDQLDINTTGNQQITDILSQAIESAEVSRS